MGEPRLSQLKTGWRLPFYRQRVPAPRRGYGFPVDCEPEGTPRPRFGVLRGTHIQSQRSFSAADGAAVIGKAALITASVLFFAWAGIFVLLLPSLLLNDADNGRFGHDLATIWAPEIGLAFAGAMYCLITLARAGARLRPWMLVPPVLLVIAIVIVTALPNVGAS